MKTVIFPGYQKAGSASYNRYFDSHPDIDHCSAYEGIARIKHKISTAMNKIFIISSSGLMAEPRHTEAWAVALHSIAPDAEIIVTKRHPLECVKSEFASRFHLYVPKPYRGRTISFENWLEFMWPQREMNYLGSLKRKNSLLYYERLFDKIHVIDFKLLKQSRAFQRVCDILNIKYYKADIPIPNPRRSKNEWIYDRMRSYFPTVSFGGLIRQLFDISPLKGKKKMEPKFPLLWKFKLEEYYKEEIDD